LASAQSLGERGVIRLISDLLARDPEELLGLGIDDAVAKQVARGLVLVAHTDMFVESTDRLPGMSYRQAGRKAAVANLSDLAAKGAGPLGLIFAWGIPREMSEEAIRQVALGLQEAAEEYGTFILGGDTGGAPELILAGTVLGLTAPGRLVKRTGARPGDVLAVTGPIGLTAIGFKMLLEGFPAPNAEVESKALRAVYTPKARLSEGLALAATGVVTGGMDISDGLAVSLHQLAEASGVGVMLTELPPCPEAYEFSEHNGLDATGLILYEGGEEFELLVSVRPDGWEAASSAVARESSSLWRIGYVTEERGVRMLKQGQELRIHRRGWEHLRPGLSQQSLKRVAPRNL